MTFDLAFHPDAHKEWGRLDATIREQFKKKSKERLQEPRVESARVGGENDLCKIKLRAMGYRLVYQVQDEVVTVPVLSVGKRDRNFACTAGTGRLQVIAGAVAGNGAALAIPARPPHSTS
jgi:mRNA interferase RelE/StbE